MKAKAKTTATKPAAKPKAEPRKTTKFGHIVGSYAGKIDAVLIAAKKPVTREQIIKLTGCKPYKVQAHIKHLIEVKKVNIVEKDGGYIVNK